MIVAVQEGKMEGELKERIWRLENGARVINAASWLQKQMLYCCRELEVSQISELGG